MKKLFLTLVMGLCAMAWAFANVNHIVEPGETLKSIAQKYGITEAKIIELNPDAAQFIYVGMELNIPANAPVAQTTTSTSTNTSNQQTGSESSYDEEKSKWITFMDASYGFLSKENHREGKNYTKGNNSTIGFTIGVGYKFYKDLYAGARIGYNSATYNQFTSYNREWITQKSTYHFISLPLELGYDFGDKIGLIPHAGFDLNLCVAGKTKYKGGGYEESKSLKDKPFAVDFNAGLRIKLWEITLHGAYHVPLTDDTKDAFGKKGYFSVGIGWFM